MENCNDRVLAYTSAKVISNDDLDKVAGGGAQATMGQTVRPTGSSVNDFDVKYDVSVDW